MKREIITTDDGSTSFRIPEWGESFHSTHGAIQETKHVFIKNGLALFSNQNISILEIGFGTGLNALATLAEQPHLNLNVHYETIEAYPLSWQEASQMNYCELLQQPALAPLFAKMHQCPWNEEVTLNSHFILKKRKQFFQEINDLSQFDLIYFDAFGAQVQPELWQEDIFQKMYNALKTNGILVTYAAKGSVRRAMTACGFTVERLQGPLGKREMLRATKA